MKHECSLTVRSYENDAYGHVNNAVYLNYLEYARGEYLRAIGFDYEACVRAGFGLWVVRVEIDYRVPARLHDELRIETQAVEKKTTYGVLKQRILKQDGSLSAEALVKWAFVDARNGRPSRIPVEFDNPALSPDDADSE
jgi:acyl-CoA thioester hydrolase